MSGVYSGYEIAMIVLSVGVSIALIAVVMLCAMGLGAYIVYKTKREDGTAFQVQAGGGDVAVAPGEYDDVDLPLGEDTSDRKMSDALDSVLQHTKRFNQQQDDIVRK